MERVTLGIGKRCGNVIRTSGELESWHNCQQNASEYTYKTIRNRANMKFTTLAVWLSFMLGYFVAVIAQGIGEVMR